MFAATLRAFEGDVGDALDLALLVNHRVHRGHLTVHFLAELWLTKIEAAREFANAEHIEAAFDQVVLHRRSVGEGRVADGRAKVGEQTEVLA